MQLTLSDDDARTLQNLLRDHLPNLRREAAATELASRELKSELNRRVEVCERVVTELERSAGPSPGRSA